MTNEQLDRGIAKAKELFNEGHFNDVLLTAYLLLILEAMKEPEKFHDLDDMYQSDLKPMSLMNTGTFNEPETETI